MPEAGNTIKGINFGIANFIYQTGTIDSLEHEPHILGFHVFMRNIECGDLVLALFKYIMFANDWTLWLKT